MCWCRSSVEPAERSDTTGLSGSPSIRFIDASSSYEFGPDFSGSENNTPRSDKGTPR
jgi:hypothetical protein